MKYELIVDNEWIYEGDWDTCLDMATNYEMDEEVVHSVHIISEDEFYGR